ncbi:MAG TPA: ribbon-helix-helix domain-containing protein [Acidimicrobiales bacterium]|nr:ribbon-helix-helix domain-containing protein [Acidimicrobiales bacterium]
MTTQIAVKLPDELVAAADQLVADGSFDSRSELVRRGIEVIVRAGQRRAVDDAYRAGYTATPETEQELAEAESLALAAIRDEPWDRWW